MNAPWRTISDIARNSPPRGRAGSAAKRAVGQPLGWVLSTVGLLALGLLGCGEQGEGERCDPANQNGDCASGLTCTQLSALNRGTSGAVCCPAANITVDICLQDFVGDADEDGPPASTIPTTQASMSAAAPDAAATAALDAATSSADAAAADAASTRDASSSN